MRSAFTTATDVDAPPARVWATLVDWDRAPRWMTGVTELRADGPPVVGTTLTFAGAGGDRRAEVVEAVPEEVLALRSTHGGVTAVYRYVLVPLVGGTRVELSAGWEPRGVLARVLGRVAADAMRRTDGDQLEALRALVEEDQGDRPAEPAGPGDDPTPGRSSAGPDEPGDPAPVTG